MNKILYNIFLICVVFLFSCKQKTAESSADSGIYYTCSMHPQIMESKPGNCPICHMPLIEVRTQKALNPGEIKLSDEQIYLGNIKTDTLRVHNLSEELVLSGTVTANTELTNEISARSMGRIENLYVRSTGDYVRKGQPLYSINSDDINLAITEYLLTIEKKASLQTTAINIGSIIESAKNKLNILGLTEKQIEKIGLNGVKGNVIDILSLFEGVVTKIDVSEGAYLMEGSPVMTVAEYNKLWVVAQVYPKDLGAVMSASVATAVIDGSRPISVKGRLTFVTPEYRTASKINEVRMDIDNKENNLRPGMRANVKVPISSKSIPSVPTNAVILGGNGATVWIRVDKNTFASKMVRVGMEANGYTEIIDGLKTGDVIVVSGAYLIHSEYLFRQGANPMEGHDMSGM